jgi:hypothetical protein
MDSEPYYSELPKLKAAMEKLNQIFAYSGEEPWTERQYETTARNLFGEAGFEIEIEWLQAAVQDEEDPDSEPIMLDFKVPNVTLVGRVKKETERDHDRIKHEVVTGLADGQKGFIREDGTRHEEPIRKIIT